MLDKKYLALQNAVDVELAKVDGSQLKVGKIIDPVNVFDTQLDVEHYKDVLHGCKNERSIIAYSKEITMLDNIDEQYYNAETGKGLTFDELQDYYNVIRQALGYTVVDYDYRLDKLNKTLETLVDSYDFDIVDIDIYEGIRLVSVDDELSMQIELMEHERDESGMMNKANRITELSNFQDKDISFVVENSSGYDLISNGQITKIFNFLDKWTNDNVDDYVIKW